MNAGDRTNNHEGVSPSDITQAELDEVWRLTAPDVLLPDFEPSRDVIWARIEQKIAETDAATVSKPWTAVHKRALLAYLLLRRRKLAFALSFVVLLGFGVGFLLWPVTISAPRGQTLTEMLPDGSQVHLNSSSSLFYRRLFVGSERAVRLKGEAFFDVVREDRPFVVKTFNAVITVLGTTFNVRAWESDLLPETAVFLESGKVQVASTGRAPRSVILVPRQMSRIIARGDEVTPPVQSDDVLAWRSGRFVFKNQPLGLILEELERRYDTRIRTNPASIRQVRYTLLRRDQDLNDLESIIRDLCDDMNYQYREVDGGYEIKALSP